MSALLSPSLSCSLPQMSPVDDTRWKAITESGVGSMKDHMGQPEGLLGCPKELLSIERVSLPPSGCRVGESPAPRAAEAEPEEVSVNGKSLPKLCLSSRPTRGKLPVGSPPFDKPGPHSTQKPRSAQGQMQLSQGTLRSPRVTKKFSIPFFPEYL